MRLAVRFVRDSKDLGVLVAWDQGNDVCLGGLRSCGLVSGLRRGHTEHLPGRGTEVLVVLVVPHHIEGEMGTQGMD